VFLVEAAEQKILREPESFLHCGSASGLALPHILHNLCGKNDNHRRQYRQDERQLP